MGLEVSAEALFLYRKPAENCRRSGGGQRAPITPRAEKSNPYCGRCTTGEGAGLKRFTTRAQANRPRAPAAVQLDGIPMYGQRVFQLCDRSRATGTPRQALYPITRERHGNGQRGRQKTGAALRVRVYPPGTGSAAQPIDRRCKATGRQCERCSPRPALSYTGSR